MRPKSIEILEEKRGKSSWHWSWQWFLKCDTESTANKGINRQMLLCKLKVLNSERAHQQNKRQPMDWEKNIWNSQMSEFYGILIISYYSWVF